MPRDARGKELLPRHDAVLGGGERLEHVAQVRIHRRIVRADAASCGAALWTPGSVRFQPVIGG
ncbi:MAG TPA: hypothetical protein VHE83_18640 [Mycobacteriales bacterium]|nr:hypothetical protein [Mycobacteriales bacterium]